MAKTLEIIAAAVAHKAHSFEFIRKATGLKMCDEVLTALARSDKTRFKLVRFVKRDSGWRGSAPGFRAWRCEGLNIWLTLQACSRPPIRHQGPQGSQALQGVLRGLNAHPQTSAQAASLRRLSS